jgi:thiol-disulfide isomerase/thioredoxin
MKSKQSLILIALMIAVLFVVSPTQPVRSGSKVEKIDPARLDQLMTDPDCGCMIAIMAAWCGPCRKELPILARLYDKYKNDGLKIIGVSLDVEGPKAIQPIVDKAKVGFPVYWAGEQAVGKYGIDALPTLLVIKNGRIFERIIGKRSEKYLDKKIEELLGAEKP